MKHALLAVLVLALAVACTWHPEHYPPIPEPPGPPEPPPSPILVVDAGPPPTPEPPPIDDAERACRHLRQLRCPDGAPTPEGHTCEEVLRHALASPAARIDPECLAAIRACSDETRCSR